MCLEQCLGEVPLTRSLVHCPWNTVHGIVSLEHSHWKGSLDRFLENLLEILVALKRASCCFKKPNKSHGKSTARYQYQGWYHMTIYRQNSPELDQLLQTKLDSGQSQPSSRCCLSWIKPLFPLRDCGTGSQVQFPCLDYLTFFNRMKNF